MQKNFENSFHKYEIKEKVLKISYIERIVEINSTIELDSNSTV